MSKGPWKGAAVGFGSIAGVLAIILGRGLMVTDPPPQVVRASIGMRREHAVEARRYFELSSDGSVLVYQAPAPDGQFQLWVRPIDGLEAFPIAGSEGLRPESTPDLSISPDGTTVVFWKAESLYVVPIGGGSSRTLVGGGVDGTTAWSPDGQWVYFGDASSRGISRVPVGGGPIESITQPEEEPAHAWPHVLPGGRVVLFVAERGGLQHVMAVDVESGEVKAIIEGQSPRYVEGYLWFTDQTGTTLNAAPFDPDLLRLTGPATPVVEGLQEPWLGHSAYAVSRSGTLVYVRRPTTQMTWVTADGATRPVDPSWVEVAGAFWSLSPDETRLAYVSAGAIWIKELDEGPTRRVHDEGGRLIGWAANDSLMFSSGADVWVTGVGGASDPRLVYHHSDRIRTASIDPAGRWLAIETVAGGSSGVIDAGRDLFALELGVDTVARLIEETPGYHASMPTISSDGRWLAFLANEGEGNEYRLFVRPFPRQDGQRIPVSLDGGISSAEWSRDGSQLFYVNRRGEMMAARISTGTPPRVTRRPLFTLGPEVRRGALVTSMQIRSDGRFLMNRDDPDAGPDIMIVVNWLEALKARLPNSSPRF